MSDLLTTRELCEKLGVSKQAIYKWRKAGCPTVVNSGNMCRYDYEAVIGWLNGRRTVDA